jgi:ribonuclease BN (tRNA processing enzyme)
VRLALLGVRGSTPAPGREFADYGGHTSCLAVLRDGDNQPRLILDAGTGLRSLPLLLAGAPFAGDIVLSHLHWDHVQGLPFCPSIDHPDAQVKLHVPMSPPVGDPVALLAQSMSPPHFPISPTGLLGHWQFAPMMTGIVELSTDAAGSVVVAPIEHKGGIAYGIRVELDGAALAYLPDHALNGDHSANIESALGLAHGVDLLVHDGQYRASEAATARNYGHATVEAALDFADKCGVGELMLTHHAPSRTDAHIVELAESTPRTPGGIPVRFARQDLVVPIGHAS